MRGTRVGVLLASTAVIVGIGACGDDDDEAAAPETPTAQETTATTEPEPSESTEGDLTPAGTKLGFGEEATVGWQPASLSIEGKDKVFKLEVVVQSLETGEKSDLEDIELDPELQDSTPYYAKVRIHNLGETPPAEDDPDITFDAIDDRGQEQASITFIGDFPPCEDNEEPKPFSRGKSYESCLTYLVPGGGSIEELRWGSGPVDADGLSEYFDKPIVWSAG